MTDLPDPLRSAILAAPDDDEPRQIAADWYEERGDPRGEFIRVQCELEGLRPKRFEPGDSEPNGSRRRELINRIAELLPIVRELDGRSKIARYERGFYAGEGISFPLTQSMLDDIVIRPLSIESESQHFDAGLYDSLALTLARKNSYLAVR